MATTVTLATTSISSNEQNPSSHPYGFFVFRVQRSGDTSGVTTVNYAVTGSGANPTTADDFLGGAFPTGTVTFAAGETEKIIFIGPNPDADLEPNEEFTLTLSDASGGATIANATATGTLLNDDPMSFSIVAETVSHPEGNSGTTPYTFTVTRTSGGMAASVVWSVYAADSNSASADDFQGGSLPHGALNFAIGETSKTITVNVVGDTAIEGNESFKVGLIPITSPWTATHDQATGIIVNDDSTAVNHAPVFTSSANVNTPENRTLAATLTASDEDHDPVTFAITGGADKAFFTVNAATGAVNWIASPDYETRQDAGANGVYDLVVTATDSHGAATNQSLAITVTNVNEPGQVLFGDWFRSDTVQGGSGDDYIQLGFVGGKAFGGDGDDDINGGWGKDQLSGGRGADTISGGFGDDTLAGDAGNDVLTGGYGDDDFRLAAPTANGVDRITDFEVNSDTIALLKGASGWNPATQAGRTLGQGDYSTRNTVSAIVASDTNKVVEIQNGQTTAQLTSGTGGAANAYVAVYNSSVGHVQVWYDDNWSNTAGRTLLADLVNVHSVGGSFGANEFSLYQ